MEWIKNLLGKHTKEGKLDMEAFMAELKTEFPKNAVPKDTFNALSEAKKKLETDLQARDTQLEELKKTAGASEDLKKQIETLQADNKKKDEDYQAQLRDLTLANAVKMAVAGKVHDEGLVAGLIDKTKLVIDGEKIVGLEDQLKSLQAEKAFLFKPADGDGDQGQKNKPGFRIGADGKQTPDPNAQPASLREAIAASLNLQNVQGGQTK